MSHDVWWINIVLLLTTQFLMSSKHTRKCHHPIWPFENPSPHPLFLHPKPRWKPKHDIWFTIALVCYDQFQEVEH
jgi:hypothetical protein